jgi:hypothetical protein
VRSAKRRPTGTVRTTTHQIHTEKPFRITTTRSYAPRAFTRTMDATSYEFGAQDIGKHSPTFKAGFLQ